MLKINNLSKSFRHKEVLKNINLVFEEGRTYGLLGNNGAGKTTLIRIIFNELAPNSGEINYDDLKQNQIDYSKWLYFVENNELPREMKVNDYLLEIGLIAGLSLKEVKKRVVESFSLFSLNFKKSDKIKNLSAGQKKLLSCLTVMVIKPNVIFFDEPTANLDRENKKIVHEIIRQLKNENRIIVIVTHLISEVQDLLTDIVILENGNIILKKTIDKFDDVQVIFDQVATSKDSYAEEIGAQLNERD